MQSFRYYHRNIKIRIGQIFLTDLVSGAIFPFIAIYFAEFFGATITGILLTVNVVISLFVGLYGGYYSDLIGRKKLMVIASILRTIAFLIMTLANSTLWLSPEVTFLMAILITASFGLDGPAADAMIIDITKPSERKGVYSLLYWSFNLAFALGGILGALTFSDYLFELLSVMSITSMLSTILVIFFISETMEKSTHAANTSVLKSMFTSYRDVAGDKLFILFVIAGLLIQSIENQLENYIAIRLNNDMPIQEIIGFSFSGVEMVGFLKSENTILVVLLTVFITKLVTRLKEGTTFLWSIVIFTLGYVGISYVNNIWLLFGFMVMATIGELMRVPIQSDFLASIPTDDKRSSYMALYGLVFNGSMMISSFFVTLSGLFSKEMMSLLIALCGLLGFVIMKYIMHDLKARRDIQAAK